MLKRLRNKLLVFNMVSLAAVVAASFAVIFFLQYTHMRSMDEDRLAAIPTGVIMNAILAERVDTRDVDTPPSLSETLEGDSVASEDGSAASGTSDSDGTEREKRPFINNAGPDLPIDYSNFFVINVDSYGVVSIFSRIEMDEESYIEAAKKAAKKGHASDGEIKFAGSHWLYSYSASESENKSDEAGNALAPGDSIVFLNIDATDRDMTRLLVSMVVIGGCVLAGLFLISLVLSGRALRPAEESLIRQKQFIADASHELKTPLAIIDANAEAALGESVPPGARTWMERIGEESSRMRGLIEDLLLLARSDDPSGMAIEKLPVDLSSAVEQEIDRVEAVLFEKGIALEFKSPSGGVTVSTDPVRVRQILLILLDNALKYTDIGGRVTVEIGHTRKHGYVKISNTGGGISTDDLPRIFDRFYRADKARNSESGGYGLGLPIARAIAERSGGTLTAASADGLSTFTLELPLG